MVDRTDVLNRLVSSLEAAASAAKSANANNSSEASVTALNNALGAVIQAIESFDMTLEDGDGMRDDNYRD